MRIVPWKPDNLREISQEILAGKAVILPSDTIYGLMAIAGDKDAVNNVYDLKGRTPDKPCIILISCLDDLRRFGVTLTVRQSGFLRKYWPGKISVVLPCLAGNLSYLHRGSKSLAFRLPDNKLLQDLLKLTGPLIAPSANPEGQVPAKDIPTAYAYFGDRVGLYVDARELISAPSTVVSLLGDQPRILRGSLPTVAFML